MFHDVSILFMLYNMDELCCNQIGMYGFEALREKERFTVVCPCCRQNPEIGQFSRVRKRNVQSACRTCSTIVFSSFNQ